MGSLIYFLLEEKKALTRNSFYRSGLVMSVSGALLWSIGGLGIRSVQAGPWRIVFWRSLFMTATVFIYVLVRYRSRTLKAFWCIGLEGLAVGGCLAAAFMFYVMAIVHTAVANALILQGTAPFFAALLGWWFLKEKVSWVTFLLIGLAIGGAIIMLSGSVGSIMLVGDLFGLGIALVFSISIVIVRGTREIDMVPAACIGGIISVVVAFFMSGGRISVVQHDLAILAFLGVVQLGIAFCLFLSGSRHLPPAESGLIVLLETVVGPMLVWFFIGESLTTHAIIGGIAIVGVLIVHPIALSRAARTR